MRELSLNILDIVQNSISAKASLIEIDINEDFKNDNMGIFIKDNGKGMTEEQVRQVIDPFFTTRTTRKVGLGVPLFKMAAEMTGGSFDISSEQNIGTKTSANFKLSHVDLVPLGDMCSTVCILIRCNPEINFIYRHKRNDKEFILDTMELRQVLGEDVSLNNEDVLKWINDFIMENIQEIYGGT